MNIAVHVENNFSFNRFVRIDLSDLMICILLQFVIQLQEVVVK